jgi:asparagine synthase (glutamine-hydrolysing)
MAERIQHRGPDDSGAWGDTAAGLWLGHRRLSILDRSPAGRQPMRSASGRWTIAYNGELFNFRSLRRQLAECGDAPAWRGESDTEVFLAAIEAWGLQAALSRAVGMFAFALWDARDRRLHLVRDRLGIKPLCFARTEDGLLFGSELRALRADPSFDAELDREALAAYLRFNCVPAPLTIHRRARKLQPGAIVSFAAPCAEARTTHYWSASERLAAAARDPLEGSDSEILTEVERALRSAVRDRLVADVPLGAFLSGGIDSSTVVALMQSESTRSVKTFSIGNERLDYDEGVAARTVAQHLGTDHTNFVVTAADALAVVPRLATMYDEPFADSSQIPTHLVSALARRHVTVALSGDGGDEVFGGYNRHVFGPWLWRTLRPFPRTARATVARGILRFSPSQWDRLLRGAGPMAPAFRLPGDKLHKLAAALPSSSASDLYLCLQSHWDRPAEVVLGIEHEASRSEYPSFGGGLAEQMMFQDLVAYLPDDILTKVDRASMAQSLEVRVPILDHRVVELAWRLPARLRHQGLGGKVALRRILRRHLPGRLSDRPKMGFGVPIDDWLRGDLRPWAEELIDKRRLYREGVFDPVPIRARWREHLRGERNWAHHLWDVLMFQAWSESEVNGSHSR